MDQFARRYFVLGFMRRSDETGRLNGIHNTRNKLVFRNNSVLASPLNRVSLEFAPIGKTSTYGNT